MNPFRPVSSLILPSFTRLQPLLKQSKIHFISTSNKSGCSKNTNEQIQKTKGKISYLGDSLKTNYPNLEQLNLDRSSKKERYFILTGFGAAALVLSTVCWLFSQSINKNSNQIPNGTSCDEKCRTERRRIAEERTTELRHAFATQSLEGLKQLFKERGHVFLEPTYAALDPWESLHAPATILESVLEEKSVVPLNLDKRKFLMEFLSKNSERSQVLGLNAIHIALESDYLTRNEHDLTLIDALICENPKLLLDKDKTKLRMSPVDMAIRKSYNLTLMKFMVDEQYKRFGLSLRDKKDLITHAEWLSGSGISSTADMGEYMMDYIQKKS